MNAGSTAPAAPPPTSRLKLKSRPPPPPSRESDAPAALLTRDDEGRNGGGMREGVTNVGARDGVAATLLLLLPPPPPPPVRLLLTPAPHAEDTSCSWPVSCSSRSFTWADRPGLAVGAEGAEKGDAAGSSDDITASCQSEASLSTALRCGLLGYLTARKEQHQGVKLSSTFGMLKPKSEL